MIGVALDAVTSFSALPVRMTTYLGLMAGATGLATLSWVLVSYLLGNVMTGWTSIAGLVLILGSVKLIVLGVKIGRASCRDRGCQYVYISGIRVYLENKIRQQ